MDDDSASTLVDSSAIVVRRRHAAESHAGAKEDSIPAFERNVLFSGRLPGFHIARIVEGSAGLG